MFKMEDILYNAQASYCIYAVHEGYRSHSFSVLDYVNSCGMPKNIES